MNDSTTFEPEERGRRHRRLWAVLVGLAALVVAFVLLAWQGGDEDGGPLNAVAAAAEKTQSEPGGRATMVTRAYLSERSEWMTMRGQMVFSGELTRGVIGFRDPGSGEPLEMHLVGDESVLYMSSRLFDDELPEGQKWMKLDLSFLEGTLDEPVPTSGDVKGELALLEALGDDVTKVGTEEVRGVSTTRYRGTVDKAERAEELRDAGAGDLAAEAESGLPLRVEVWIDDDGLVRRMRYIRSERGEEGRVSVTMDMRVDFYDFDFEPEIEVPDSSEVFDLTELAREEAGLPSD